MKNKKLLITVGSLLFLAGAFWYFKTKGRNNSKATPYAVDLSKPPQSIVPANMKLISSGNEAKKYDYDGYVVYEIEGKGYMIPINGVNFLYNTAGFPIVGT